MGLHWSVCDQAALLLLEKLQLGLQVGTHCQLDLTRLLQRGVYLLCR